MLLGVAIDQLVLAVVALRADHQGPGREAAEPHLCGSIFCIGNGLWMTAAHVMREAEAAGRPALAYLDIAGGGTVKASPLIDVDYDEDCDLAVARSEFTGIVLGDWYAGSVQLLTDLGIFGYPAAVSPSTDRWECLFRATKGHVIARRTFDRLTARPPVYETSARLPGGFSGAPALLEIPGGFMVTGVVLGQDPLRYRGETMQVGIVLTSDFILSRSFRLLGDVTLAEYLRRNTPTRRASRIVPPAQEAEDGE